MPKKNLKSERMQKLPPIPTPIGTQWREFRYNYVPIITFVAIVCIVVVMWRNYVIPPYVLAQVEPVTANVISTAPGVLISLDVERFQRVTNGQEIGQVMVLESNVLAASMGAVSAELRVMGVRIEMDQQRALRSYEQERLTFLQEKVQHDTNKKLLALYASDFRRASNQWHVAKPALITEAQYDLAKANYEKTLVAVEETEKYLLEKEKVLPRLLMETSNQVATIDRSIKAEEAKLQAEFQNIILRAPIDGTVSVISNRPGERIVPGRPIVVITPLTSDRVIGYVRQPINVKPKINDWVEIRRQTYDRAIGLGRVVQVGTQLDRVDPSLLPAPAAGAANTVELGLPFLVKVLDKMELSPGERVDLILNPAPRKTTVN